MATFKVLDGDITAQEVDAIVTLINSEGMWLGGVDGAIYRVAGDHYHAQVGEKSRTSGLRNGQVVVARGNRGEHTGSFDDVIFVVDDLESPLSLMVSLALETASREGYDTIAFPLMRTGVMLGKVEKDLEAVVEEITKAFKAFDARGEDMDVIVVVYQNDAALGLLEASLASI